MLKYLLSLAAVVGIAVPIVLVFALGGGNSLPAPPACPSPTPIPFPTPARNVDPGQAPFRAYQRSINAGVQRLTDLRDNFRKRYPTDTFFRHGSFRTDFATYADASICAAQQILAAKLPDGPTTSGISVNNAALTTALNDFIANMQDGRQAVANRNTTKYQAWYRVNDARLQAIRDALTNPNG